MNSSITNDASVGGVDFVLATRADLEAIVAIEQQSFLSPWPPQFFLSEFAQPHSQTLLARQKSAAKNGPILAYLIFWVLFDEMHILNLAVKPACRRQGIGRQILQEALRRARNQGCRTAWLEVRLSNTAALALYASFDFQVVMTRKGYYSDTGEDALILFRRL